MDELTRKQLANGEALLAPDAKLGIDYRAYAKGRRTPTAEERLAQGQPLQDHLRGVLDETLDRS